MHTLDQPREVAAWLRSNVTGVLQCDSRRLQPGDGFVAWPGAATDGRRFVRAALDAGAAAAVVEREGLEAFGLDDPRVLAVPGLKTHAGAGARAVWGGPGAARDVGASIIIRGLRAVADFEYEFQMVGMNRALDSSIETVFMMADARRQAIASKLVKEIARLGGDVSKFVTPPVEAALKARYAKA